MCDLKGAAHLQTIHGYLAGNITDAFHWADRGREGEGAITSKLSSI